MLIYKWTKKSHCLSERLQTLYNINRTIFLISCRPFKLFRVHNKIVLTCHTFSLRLKLCHIWLRIFSGGLTNSFILCINDTREATSGIFEWSNSPAEKGDRAKNTYRTTKVYLSSISPLKHFYLALKSQSFSQCAAVLHGEG